uniref:uncharacterized protein LOC122581849 n=1 Tax=Erigeron canadensis TaxID=72917 RepID=UPI001CB94630|nr:uncharacterized protein LOC122581849 [Erigeron canadensis]
MSMDIDVLASIDVNKSHGLCMHTIGSSSAGTGDLSVNNLGNDMFEFQNIQHDKAAASCSKPLNGQNEFQKKDGATEKFFIKCDASPCSSKTTSSNESCVEVEFGAEAITGENSTDHDNIKFPPTTFEPVSAMKGSREKRGATPSQKLAVRWSPDVYDPVPTSVSHVVTNNKPQKQSKKNSKSKQKKGSKSSHKNKYKDKLAGKKGGG